jgi:hypothetical protein
LLNLLLDALHILLLTRLHAGLLCSGLLHARSRCALCILDGPDAHIDIPASFKIFQQLLGLICTGPLLLLLWQLRQGSRSGHTDRNACSDEHSIGHR